MLPHFLQIGTRNQRMFMCVVCAINGVEMLPDGGRMACA